MAPRRRSRKVGLTRMHAALDAMRPLGFADSVVRKSIRSLLKVYGGDEGWGFIEEAAYKVLIDAILEEQEQAPKDIQQEHNQLGEMEIEQQECVQESHELVECVDEACDPQEGLRDIYEQEVFDKDIYEEKLEGQKSEAENCLALKENVSLGELGEPINFLPNASSSLDCLPTQNRQPCHGWISSDDDDDDDDDDFVFLMPAEQINPH